MFDWLMEALTSNQGAGLMVLAAVAGWARSAWLKKIWKDNESIFEWFFEVTQENIPETSKAAEKWLNKPNKKNFQRLYGKLERWKDVLTPSEDDGKQKQDNKEE